MQLVGLANIRISTGYAEKSPRSLFPSPKGYMLRSFVFSLLILSKF